MDIKNRTYYFYNYIIDTKHWIHHKEKNWWLWNNLQCESFVFTYWSWKWVYWRKIFAQKSGFSFCWWKQRVNKKYNDVLNVIKYIIKKVSDSEFDYKKDYMKINFNSDDNLLSNKPLKFHLMTITIRWVFQEDGKLYPQVYLDDSLYELNL